MQEAAPVISVISPVYGCRSCLEELVDRVAINLNPLGETFEIILVDDASPDGAWLRIIELASTRPWLRGFRLSRNFGQHHAIAAGLKQARGSKVVVMDCDLQDVPEELPKLLTQLREGVEVVLAQRVQRQDRFLKRISSRLFYRFLSWLTDTPYDHTVANFGAYSRKVVDTINSMPEADRFFPLLVRWTGYRTAHVPVHHGQRSEGRSGYTMTQLVRLAINVAISFSDKPLRLVVKLGLIFAMLAMCVVIYSIYRYLIGDIRVAGFTSLLASIWLVGSLVLCSTGVVGLYVGRLFNNAKKRPHYIISECINGSP
jgi:glycosyltransferase involved in cell wall biosynthesis